MDGENIPFIGELVDARMNKFVGTCLKGDPAIPSLNIQGDSFEIEVNLKSAVDKSRLTSEEVYVVIGIDVEVQGNDNSSRTVLANILDQSAEDISLALEKHENLRLKIVSTLLSKIEKTYTGIRDIEVDCNGFIVNSIKAVPGKYLASLCDIVDSNSSLVQVEVDGTDYLALLNEFAETMRNFSNFMKKIRFCVTSNDFKAIDELNREFSDAEIKFKSAIQKLAKDKTLFGLRKNLSRFEWECEALVDFLDGLKYRMGCVLGKYRKKSAFLKILLEDGIEYLGACCSLKKYLKEIDVNVFMIFISEIFDCRRIFSNLNDIYKLMDKYPKGTIFLIIDLDVANTIEEFFRIPNEPVIYHFKNKLLSKDVLNDLKTNQDIGFVYFKADNKTQVAPRKKCVLNIRCPGSFFKMCNEKILNWKCAKCKTNVKYGFDEKLYCSCGGCEIENCKYQCSDYRHTKPIRFKDLEALYRMLEDLVPLEEINILLIGESGVGKSTWINAVANYLTFKSLDEAEKHHVISVVPTHFTVSDEKFESYQITVGEDRNEHQIIGASSTQICRTYPLGTEKRIIRFIDTPGIGDTRGYEKDAENIINVIEHIQSVEEIHGICFLAKPNATRSIACFKFCMKELFIFLHKKAWSNIVFCFTNARSTNYQPGETLPIIRKILQECRIDPQIKLNENTVYCFDNESFRFLCALKINLTFSEQEKESFAESWERSVRETNRLISHIAFLQPYDVSATITIADLRLKISSVIDTLHEMTKNSSVLKIQSLNIQKNECSQKIEDLNKSKTVEDIILKRINVNGDIVCSNASCTEKFNDETVYKICCDGCRETTNNYETLRNADLLKCEKLSEQTCKTCKCRWEQHMMIKYRLLKEKVYKTDASVQEKLSELKELKQNLVLSILKAEVAMKQEEEDEKTLTEFGCKIFKYLKRYSLLLHNDSLMEYLDYLISTLETEPKKTDDQKLRIKKLYELKDKQEKEMKMAESVKNEKILDVSLKNIEDEELFVEQLTSYEKKPNRFSWGKKSAEIETLGGLDDNNEWFLTGSYSVFVQPLIAIFLLYLIAIIVRSSWDFHTIVLMFSYIPLLIFLLIMSLFFYFS